MDVESNPAVQAQKAAHPELAEQLDELEKLATAKVYHQLTTALLAYLDSPVLLAESPAIADELRVFFDSFIKPFQEKFDKVKWVQILQVTCLRQKPDTALEIIAPYETLVEKNKAAKHLWLVLKAEKLTQSAKLDEAKEILDTVGKEISEAYDVQAIVQSNYHKACALLWKVLNRPYEFYKSSILYLSFTALASIPKADRAKLAFEIGVAALIAEEEFDFVELLKQDIVSEMEGTSMVWLKDLLVAFGEGRFALYDAALASHRALIDATPELKAAEATVLRPKMEALALMELSFMQDSKQRRLAFDSIANHCRVGPKDVEFLIMKAMCANLIRGKINEMEQYVSVTWVRPRILDAARVGQLKTRMDEWSTRTGALLDQLEDMTPELLVSC